MNDQAETINNVLGDYTPLTNDHPAAQQLLADVAALKAAEAVDTEFTPVTVEMVPACIIRPGDVLVLTTDHALTAEMVDRIKAELFRKLPNIADVVVLGNLQVSGVYREGTE